MKQRTLRTSKTISGIALHTGHRVMLTVRPAPADSGIRFRRTDLPGAPEIPAHVSNVVDVQRGTTLAVGDARVHTVEHLLAAIHALGVDNAVVDMGGPEPPVCDGSSASFVRLIREAGLEEQPAEARVIDVPEMLFVEAGETKVVAIPDDAFRISCTVKFDASQLDCQFFSASVAEECFVSELSRARTFCLYHEIEALMKAGLICGGSLDNAVVIKGSAILSKEGLRYPDEFVRHKVLDMVGDLFLAGGRIRGQFIAVKPGHPANVKTAARIAERIMGNQQ